MTTRHTPGREPTPRGDVRVREGTEKLEQEVRGRQVAEAHVTDLLRKLVTSQERERARIARGIHDEIGQQLTALRLTLERLETAARNDPQSNLQIASALDLTRRVETGLDFLAWELRPVALDDLGLGAAFSTYVALWSWRAGIAAEFHASGLDGAPRPDVETETTFYRIAQEALNNVAKHAHASRVDVLLARREGSLTLVIEDDGAGFDVEATDGAGIPGMRERAALVGASLQIESSAGGGTTVLVRHPMARAGR